jgi:hypothetical protein
VGVDEAAFFLSPFLSDERNPLSMITSYYLQLQIESYVFCLTSYLLNQCKRSGVENQVRTA